jgi:hypothetical protein
LLGRTGGGIEEALDREGDILRRQGRSVGEGDLRLEREGDDEILDRPFGGNSGRGLVGGRVDAHELIVEDLAAPFVFRVARQERVDRGGFAEGADDDFEFLGLDAAQVGFGSWRGTRQRDVLRTETGNGADTGRLEHFPAIDEGFQLLLAHDVDAATG